MNRIASSICILGACVAIAGMDGLGGTNRDMQSMQLAGAGVALFLALVMAFGGKVEL